MVANGVGVIDEDYCGPKDEVKIQVLNFTQAPVEVKRGDRIAQGLFIPVARASWQEEAGDLREGSRGGFGATGTR
jgi:dUTP pyrophosphatase